MKKHPNSFKLEEPLRTPLQEYADDGERAEPFVIYDGPVRELCSLAPNNVNTMACAAMAGVGFDKTHARLIADKSLTAHVVDINVEAEAGLSVRTERYNPAATGAVTGAATYDSFLSSLKRAGGKGSGLFFC
jgi:aspartate dehydrogenase